MGHARFLFWPGWFLHFFNDVFAAYQAAGILSRRYVTEANVVRQGAEERDSVSDEHGHASDGEMLNQSGAQEALNRDSTIDIEMVGARRGRCWRWRAG